MGTMNKMRIRSFSLEKDGFVGQLYTGTRAPGKAILYVGGAGCKKKMTLMMGQYLVDAGFTVLFLGFYLWDDLSKDMWNIPVDYAGRAAAWLKKNGCDICMIGTSTGAGYTLLSASLVPEISGVVALSGFDHVMEGCKFFHKPSGHSVYGSSIIPFTFAMVIMPATMVSVLPIGGLLVKGGSLGPEDFVTVIILSVGVITPIITMMSYSDDFRTMGTIFGEVRGILEAPEMARPETGEVPQSNSLQLRDVHFSYKEKEVLHGVTLEIPEGSFVALVGPSGSGKSTIARLIASLWDVDSGSITLGGTDIRQIPQEAYADKIAFVSQDNYLFNMSVRENIRLGRPEATDAEVEEAAKQSGCHDFIMSLENGYDTLVLVLALFVMGGLGGEQMKGIKMILSALPFLLLLIERQWKRFARGAAMLVAGYGLLFVMPYLPGALNYLALMCGGILTRFVVTVVMGEYLIATTSVSEFISAMERLHMPQAVTIPMSVMFRLFPTIGSEWRSIRRAMTMRGIHLGGAKGGQILEYQLVPMMTSTVRIGEELSASALTRGLSAPVKRTNICRIGFRAQDWVLLALGLFAIAVWILELGGVELW